MNTNHRSMLRAVAAIIAVGLGFLTILPGLAAQQAQAPGTRLRVTASDLVPPDTRGLLVSWEEDALVLDPEDLAETVTLPFSSVTCLEQYTGDRRVGGVIVGGFLGGLAWIAIARGNVGSEETSTSSLGYIWTPIAIAVGAVIGGAVGKSEVWEPVPPPTPDFSWSCSPG